MSKKRIRQKEPAKPPPKVRYEDSKRFKAFEQMMRTNKGIQGPM